MRTLSPLCPTDTVEISMAWSEYQHGLCSRKTVLGTTYVDSWTDHAAVFNFHPTVGLTIYSQNTSIFNYPISDEDNFLDSYQFALSEEINGTFQIPVIHRTAKFDAAIIIGKVKDGAGPPKWFNPCEFSVGLSQLDCEVKPWRSWHMEYTPDTSFGETIGKGEVLWAPGHLTRGQTREQFPRLINDNRDERQSQAPYNSVLKSGPDEYPIIDVLCNSISHSLVETVAIGSPMRSLAVLSAGNADFGKTGK
jgi:hypothetical protein